MPRNGKCYVLECKNRVQFSFPKASRQAWLDAIGRPNDNPKPGHGLCYNHFSRDDYMPVRFSSDDILVRKRLRTGTIPSLNLPQGPFPKKQKVILKKLPDNSTDGLGVSGDIQPIPLEDSIFGVSCDAMRIPPENEANAVQKESQVPRTESNVIADHVILGQLECGSEVIISQELDTSRGRGDSLGVNILDNAEVCANENLCDNKKSAAAEKPLDSKTPKNPKQKYDIHDYKDRPVGVMYYTGLETYFKFISVFQSLRTDIFPITYEDCEVKILSLENQFFLTLWKLRRNTPDFELGDHFGISRTTVSNIFVSMISFMVEQWGKIINIPEFLKGKVHLPGNTLMKDCNLATERVDIDYLIGLTKTYKMLSEELDSHYVPYASEIFFVCAMLCNFRESISS